MILYKPTKVYVRKITCINMNNSREAEWYSDWLHDLFNDVSVYFIYFYIYILPFDKRIWSSL